MNPDYTIPTVLPESNLALPEAAILDIDGTLIDVRPVMHHVLNSNPDVDAFVAGTERSPAMPEALEFCKRNFEAGRIILVFTARTPRWRDLTIRQLERHVLYPYRGPYMRASEDRRHDVLVKLDMYKRAMRHYNVVSAIDDHPGVVDLWKDLGIPEVESTTFTTYDDTYREIARRARQGVELPRRVVID